LAIVTGTQQQDMIKRFDHSMRYRNII